MFEDYTIEEKKRVSELLEQEGSKTEFDCAFFFPDDSSFRVRTYTLPKRGENVNVVRYGFNINGRFSYSIDNNNPYGRSFVVKRSYWMLNVPNNEKELILERYSIRGEVLLRRDYNYYYWRFMEPYYKLRRKLKQWLKSSK